MSQSKFVIVLVGQSGQGKTTFMNKMARNDALGKTGKYKGQTAHINDYEFTRDGKTFSVVDTVGLHDNRDLGLTDDKILKMVEKQLGLYPKTHHIRFILVQALSEQRFNIMMEAEKYKSIFGEAFLKSSLILGSCLDKVDAEEREETKAYLAKEMTDKFKMDFVHKSFSAKDPETDKMVSEVVQALSQLPAYSNAEIAKIQSRVQNELQNQKNRAKNAGNFESFLEPRQVQESVPVTKERVKTWTETQQIVHSKKLPKILGFNAGKKQWVETIHVPRQVTETYVQHEMQTVTRNFEAFRLKYSEDQLYQKAKDIVADQIKNGQ